MKRSRAQSGRGFTLVEALMASVVLAMAATAMTMPFVASARNDQEDARRTQAVALAQEMMEEILAKPFHDDLQAQRYHLGRDSGENVRGDFDNIDDYDGYDEPAGEVKDMTGAVVEDAAAQDLSRHVDVAYVYVSGQSASAPASFARVTVEVKHDGQTIVRLARLVFAVNE